MKLSETHTMETHTMKAHTMKAHTMKHYKVAIVGAGAAGLYCALHCSRFFEPGSVVLFEGNDRVGAKLAVAGKGRCNVTHEGYIRTFFSAYGPASDFVKSALKGHDNRAVRKTLDALGLPTHAEADGRVFPDCESGRRVAERFQSACEAGGVQIELDTHVSVIVPMPDATGFRLTTTGRTLCADAVVIATGGCSYPGLGTKGDGFRWAEALGHAVETPRPALAGVIAHDLLLKALQGTALCAGLAVYREGVCVHRVPYPSDAKTPNLLMTHFGLSGPLILGASRYMRPGDSLQLQWTAHDPETLEAQWQRLSKQSGNGRRPVSFAVNLLAGTVPDAFKRSLYLKAGVTGDVKLSETTKAQRRALCTVMAAYPVTVNALQGFEAAMVTAGGVALNAVDPKTMASKRHPGLYFIGEVLDVDGLTGGYNLQWAFSSGYAAAQSIRASAQ